VVYEAHHAARLAAGAGCAASRRNWITEYLRAGISSLPETETAYKISESRIAPQWIELRADQHDCLESSLVGFFEPVHRLVIVPETHIDQGNVGIDGSVLVLELR
jgi:hypothetical protein